jgi:hypothetical protein
VSFLRKLTREGEIFRHAQIDGIVWSMVGVKARYLLSLGNYLLLPISVTNEEKE